jgi:glycosyltransferase involved in cell wall biosynthesis
MTQPSYSPSPCTRDTPSNVRVEQVISSTSLPHPQQEAPWMPKVGVLALVPDRWSAVWQLRNQILTRLAKYFHVVWLDPPHQWREVFSARPGFGSTTTGCPPGFSVFRSPIWLPKFYRPDWLAEASFRKRLELARNTLVRRGCRTIVLYMWRPEFAAALESAHFDLSCYHIDDEYSFSAVELPVSEPEARLTARVDQVFIHSQALLDKKGKINPNTALVPNGVDYEAYARSGEEPADLRAIPHPRVGYAGLVKKQLDWPLLLALTVQHREWSFVFVGAVSPHPETKSAIEKLSMRPNVFFLGRKTVWELAKYPQHFDVCIMPYQLDDYTKYIYPLKLHEYLACGQPVVGTRIPALDAFRDIISQPQGAQEWAAAIEDALQPAAKSEAARGIRRAVAQQHDWEMIVRKVASEIANRLGPQYAALLESYPSTSNGPHPSS